MIGNDKNIMITIDYHFYFFIFFYFLLFYFIFISFILFSFYFFYSIWFVQSVSANSAKSSFGELVITAQAISWILSNETFIFVEGDDKDDSEDDDDSDGGDEIYDGFAQKAEISSIISRIDKDFWDRSVISPVGMVYILNSEFFKSKHSS